MSWKGSSDFKCHQVAISRICMTVAIISGGIHLQPSTKDLWRLCQDWLDQMWTNSLTGCHMVLAFECINNDKSCLFPIKNLHIFHSFKYTKIFGRKLFNYNSFSKNFSSLSNFSCHCNDPHLKKFVSVYT